MLRLLKKIIPAQLFALLAPTYHWLLAHTGALLYGFPSRKLIVVGVTGTKGKSSTIEFLNAILEEAGYSTAIASTIRFKIGSGTKANLYKMTMPGRFFVQRFLREAKDAGVTHALIEMTSEGAKQYRTSCIDMDALIVTNIAPEHIESHGSFENYLDAKLSIGRSLARSRKARRTLVVNADEPKLAAFQKISNVELHLFSPAQSVRGQEIALQGTQISIKIAGEFNAKNALAAATLAQAWGIDRLTIQRGLEKLATIPGRVENIAANFPAADFSVIVDYAHTPDSLSNLYGVFSGKEKICVLSGTGGGRDTWKRPVMGEIADKHCSQIILTDEDPYDEDPKKIVTEIQSGIKTHAPEIILDRRAAIARAIALATPGSAILITGKGTDPYIMGPNGTKTPWSDAAVAKEELQKHFSA